MVLTTITADTLKLFRDTFDADVDVFYVFNGTGANVLSMSSATRSYNAVLCADISHMYCDESSARKHLQAADSFRSKQMSMGS